MCRARCDGTRIGSVRKVPASFAKDLCGYRKTGKPNTSDATEDLSVDLGNALFQALGVKPGTKGEVPTGKPFSERVAKDLKARLAKHDSGLEVAPERHPRLFEQYRHVGALRSIKPEPSKEFTRALAKLTTFARRNIQRPPRTVARLEALIEGVEKAIGTETDQRRLLLEEVGYESLLGLDVTVARPRPAGAPLLEIGISLKWSLRTDRAQDCRVQGAKMAALRRGRMPHFAVVTMEPRPYMLNLLGGGSGDLDCVYHLDLPALTAAVQATCTTPSRRSSLDTFNSLVRQRRLRDYDELVQLAMSL